MGRYVRWGVLGIIVAWVDVLARHGVDSDLRSKLLASYEQLDAYAEVPTVLNTLRGQGFRLAIPEPEQTK